MGVAEAAKKTGNYMAKNTRKFFFSVSTHPMTSMAHSLFLSTKTLFIFEVKFKLGAYVNTPVA